MQLIHLKEEQRMLSKAALLSFKVLSKEMGAYKINVNAIFQD